MISVIAYTGGEHVPGARFRVRQYVSRLRRLGIDLVESFPSLGCYPPANRWLRPAWALGSWLERMPAVMRSRRFDMTFLQREMLSTLITWEPFTKKPRILDVDDAIWMNRASTARKLATLCDRVICGNSYLAERFCEWNPQVSILPTAVDTDRFRPPAFRDDSARPIIGWSGGSGGLAELYRIEGALGRVFEKHPSAVLRVISDRLPRFRTLAPRNVEFVPWSTQSEVARIQEMSVALMPLADNPWNRGKCSYKMLLAMSCGVAVVASPVGMNSEVLAQGDCGVGPTSSDDWVDALSLLLSNPSRSLQMGAAGREVIERHYSLDILSPRLASELATLAGG